MKKKILFMLLFTISIMTYAQTNKNETLSKSVITTEKQTHERENYLLIQLSKTLLNNLKYGKETDKIFIVKAYQDHGHIYINQIENRISDISTNKHNRKIILHYLQHVSNKYGDDYTVERLIKMGMKQNDVEDLMYYVMNIHLEN